MRVYRSVCTYIWNDDKFPYVSDDCQLVWFHIFTNPLSSPLGVFRASVAGLAEDKNRNGQWPLTRYRKAFQEGITQGFLEYDDKVLLVAFPKYFSHDHLCNHPVSPNVVLNWGMRYRELPDSPLKASCYQSLKVLLEGKAKAFMEAFTKAFTEASSKPSGMPSVNTDPNPNPDPNPKKDTLVRWREQAGVFWQAYPRKTGKGNVEKWFKRYAPTDELLEAMLKKLIELQATHDWQKDNGRFIPLPYTWLNGKRWDDEVSTPPPRKGVL